MAIRRFWAFIWPLLLMVAIAAGITIYLVETPADRIVARLLTYDYIFRLLVQHIELIAVSAGLAIVTAIPLGIVISRPKMRLLAPVIVNIVNIGQTVPSLAVLALFMTILGVGFRTAIFALWIYSLLPILRNTYAGLRSVAPDILEAARGMGLTPWRILTHIELPLARPVILAGVRTAIIINVGTATLGTFISAGGLGDLIVTGLSLMRYQLLIEGAVLASLLAIALDYLIGWIEKYGAA